MQRTFEETQTLPSERSATPHHADVIATMGDPLLRDSVDRALLIKSVFGDSEAFLAEQSGEIIANLQVVARTLRLHPERALATVLGTMSFSEKKISIERIRHMIDQIEASMSPDLPGNAVPMMLTGTRSVECPDEVRAALVKIIERITAQNPIVGIVGGAAGADQLWAEALIETGTYFVMVVPNWAYPYKYDRVEDFKKIKSSAYCLGFEYTVERPEVPDWEIRWGREKWWLDNFSRNSDMIGRTLDNHAGIYAIVGPHHPADILNNTTEIRGGTAACVRDMHKMGVDRAIYVPSNDPQNIVWVNF